jgi:hypothetical protein
MFRQTWDGGLLEMIVFSDCPGQTLKLASASRGNKEVRVLTTKGRLPSLGAKYNVMAALARGTHLMPMEDDDVILCNHVAQAVERIGGAAYWNPQRVWWLNGGELHSDHQQGVCHHASIFTKKAWADVGGYPETSGAQDALMDQKLKALGPMPPPLGADPREWTYLYCWGRSPCHLSGSADHEQFYRDVGGWPIVPGTFHLRPHWERDYEALVQSHLASFAKSV